jgi:hypothetical protein
VSPGTNAYELLQNFTFGLQPIGQGGAVVRSSRTPKLARTPLDLFLDSEVFPGRENHHSFFVRLAN